MIAGEFAVLEPRHKLIAMAVDRFVYATLLESEENQLSLESFSLLNITWDYHDHAINIDSNDGRIKFVKHAMKIALNYLEEQSIYPSNFSLKISSELDDASGIKYGLGSSAAVVTSVITVILEKYLPQSPAKDLIFKLAAISHCLTQGSGSGADIAASSYGGILEYTSFQAEWLMEEFENKASLTELVEKKWLYLSVKRIELPKKVSILIGWTGKPASTTKLVDKILELKTTNPKQFQRFLHDSETAVNKILQGIKEDNIPIFLTGIKQNRRSLSTVGEKAGVEIETELLRVLCDLAEQFTGAGKPSGAGGGDCGIAFVTSLDAAEELVEAWVASGIKPLAINVYPFGPKII